MNEFEEEIVYETIKDELKKFRNSNLYKCSYCEKFIEWDDANYNPEESTYICPICRETFDEKELQSVSFIDYIEEVFSVYKGVNRKWEILAL